MKSILCRHAGRGMLLLRSGIPQPACSAACITVPAKHLHRPAGARRTRTYLAAANVVTESAVTHEDLRLYEQPALYDAVFSQRNFADEVRHSRSDMYAVAC